MSVLRNRTVPPGIYENITQTGLPEAIEGLLLTAITPSRRSKLFRVLFNGRPLWLRTNRTTFKTRPSAKNAVVSWLLSGLHEVVTDRLTPRTWNNWRAVMIRLGLSGDTQLYEAERLLRTHVDALFTRGVLEIEEISLADAQQAEDCPTIVS